MSTNTEDTIKRPEGYYNPADENGQWEVQEGDLVFDGRGWLKEDRAAFGMRCSEDTDVLSARPIKGYQAAPDKALTYDDGKPPLALVPEALIEGVARALDYGKEKYGDSGNFRKGMEVTRNLSCCLRHIFKYLSGEDRDPESGLHHLESAATRLGFVLQNIKDGTEIDDRCVFRQDS